MSEVFLSCYSSYFYTGLSQDVNLTRTPDGITCLDDIAVFTCSVSTQLVRWVAEPYISRNLNSISFANLSNRVGQTIVRGPENAITITLVSLNPLTTTMNISGNLIANLTVECEATDDGVNTVQNEQLMYQAGGELIFVMCVVE